MKHEITCPFYILSSHSNKSVGFAGKNHYSLEITNPFIDIFGEPNTNMEISEDGDRYILKITSDSLDSESKQLEFIDKFAKYVSFLIGKTEKNPHYGTPFIQIEYHEFMSRVGTGGIQMSESLSIEAKRNFKINPGDFNPIELSPIYSFYFDGLCTSELKSKFFHWFLILEYIESSRLYKSKFDGDLLFTSDEIDCVNNFSNSFEDERKKSIIKSILSRTKLSRTEKLKLILSDMKISSICIHKNEVEISEKFLKTLIDQRNSLFHSSSTFSENNIWHKLFPLVNDVMTYLSNNHNFLSKQV